MAEPNKDPNGGGASAPSGEPGLPVIQIVSQYVKDLSFENPNAPGSLQQQTQPQINVQVNVTANPMTDTDIEVTLSFQTVEGTATTSDQDYAAKTGALTFAPGETTKTITIVVNGDSKKEANETFYLDLFGNSSNSLFTNTRGIGTILNDD